jgi:hypothetical protein
VALGARERCAAAERVDDAELTGLAPVVGFGQATHDLGRVDAFAEESEAVGAVTGVRV